MQIIGCILLHTKTSSEKLSQSHTQKKQSMGTHCLFIKMTATNVPVKGSTTINENKDEYPGMNAQQYSTVKEHPRLDA